MDAITKAAVITWLLDRKIRVNIWEMGVEARKPYWCAMVETPPCGRRGGAVTYPADQKVGCGTGATPIQALLKALDKIGGVTLEFRLHLLEFVVEHLANRAAPALLRRIEHGRS